jgi:hypothetical protein
MNAYYPHHTPIRLETGCSEIGPRPVLLLLLLLLLPYVNWPFSYRTYVKRIDIVCACMSVSDHDHDIDDVDLMLHK